MALVPASNARPTRTRHLQYVHILNYNFVVRDANGNELNPIPPITELVRTAFGPNAEIPGISGTYRIVNTGNANFQLEFDRMILRIGVSSILLSRTLANSL